MAVADSLIASISRAPKKSEISALPKDRQYPTMNAIKQLRVSIERTIFSSLVFSLQIRLRVAKGPSNDFGSECCIVKVIDFINLMGILRIGTRNFISPPPQKKYKYPIIVKLLCNFSSV